MFGGHSDVRAVPTSYSATLPATFQLSKLAELKVEAEYLASVSSDLHSRILHQVYMLNSEKQMLTNVVHAMIKAECLKMSPYDTTKVCQRRQLMKEVSAEKERSWCLG